MQDLFRLVRQLQQPEPDDPLPGDMAELLGEYDPPLSPDEERLVYGPADHGRRTIDDRRRKTDNGRQTTDGRPQTIRDSQYAICDTR